MLTLADIDEMFPETHDGSVYSDLHKDVYGFRPRGISFDNLEAFDTSYQKLVEELEIKIAEEKISQDRAFVSFKKLLEKFNASSFKAAVDLLAIELDMANEVNWYGYEYIEHEYGLKYGSIKSYIESK